MLSVTNLSSANQASRYYEKDDYYAKEDSSSNEASAWGGRGAHALGLSGQVDKDVFQELLKGNLPNGQMLGRYVDGQRQHRPGFDLTFSAPKSVSILIEVYGDKAVQQAHDKAVKSAMNYMEKHTAISRITVQDQAQHVKTGNFVMAQFKHSMSRAQEPQTHTHVVVLNTTQCQDGHWRSVSNEEIYRHKMTAGMVYRSELAKGLTDLSHSIEVTHPDGRFEILGFPKSLRDDFSSRRKDIEASLEERGETSSKYAEKVALMTRTSKQAADSDALREEWLAKCESHGLDISKHISDHRPSKANNSTIAREAVNYAINHLSERETRFEVKDIIKEALIRGLGEATLKDIQTRIHQAQREGILLERSNNMLTTQKALNIESQLIKTMEAGKQQVQSIEHQTLNPKLSLKELVTIPLKHLSNTPPLSVDDFLNGKKLTEGQKAAAKMILTTHDRISGIQGYAGTGKTTMLKAVKSYADKARVNVIGVSPKASASHEIEVKAGITSHTLAKFLALNTDDAKTPNQQQFQKNCQNALIVLDESSMASNQQMKHLFEAVGKLDAQLVLVGDHKQLSALNAGKPFGLLQENGMTTTVMKDIVRQKNSVLLEAVHDSISGKIESALTRLGDEVVENKNKDSLLAHMATDYLALTPTERANTLVLAPGHSECKDLNQMIRSGLFSERILKGNSVNLPVLSSVNMSTTQMRFAQNYQSGLVIRANRDYKGSGIHKNQYYQVTGVDAEKGIVHLSTKKGGSIAWKPGDVKSFDSGSFEVFSKQERELATGDLIRWTRNDYQNGIRNSDTARVQSIKDSKVSLTLNNGKSFNMKTDTLSSAHWDHAYAATVNFSQGKTASRTLAYLNSTHPLLTHQRALYIELSRSKHSTKIYTENKQDLIETLQKQTGEKYSAMKELSYDKQQLDITPKSQAIGRSAEKGIELSI